MAEGQRSLEAIMFTDLVGYTSMAQADESATLELLTEHRKIVRRSLAKHSGREIKTIGDAFLVVFPDPVHALGCAVEVQRLLYERNAASEPSRRVTMRVGIHYGDVVYTDDGKDVYGNTVNVASRVEPLADPGGICVTSQVYESAKGLPEFAFENLGEHDLKNVEVPISIFKVLLPWQATEEVQTQGAQTAEAQATPLFGREPEKAKLASILREAIRSRDTGPKAVFVGGEAGIGKTRLMDWFLREAIQQGANVARGYCQADVSIPYFAVSEAFGRYLTDNQNRVQAGQITFANWLRTSTKSNLGYAVEVGRTQMFEATVRLLAGLSEKRLFILCMEDLQWADTGTIALLHYLARNGKGMNILLACTYRTEDLGGESRSHPLADALQLMAREGISTVIEMGRLGPEAIEGIVGTIIGESAGGSTMLIAKESEGNPLFAVEYARLVKAEHGGDPSTMGKALTGIPGSVQGVIARRLSRLRPEERRMVDCASVLGERFEPLLLADVADTDRLATIETLDSVVRGTKILREEVDGREVATFRFDHAKIRDAVLNEMTVSLRQELHRRTARALLRHFNDERAEELAYHYREGKQPEEAKRYASVAGDRARGRFAHLEAAEYYGWALDGTRDSEGSQADRIHALLGRALSYYELGLAKKSLADAEEILRRQADESSRATATRLCAASLFDLGKFTESLNYCNSAVEAAETGGDEVERLRLRLIGARIAGYRGEPLVAVGAMKRVQAEARALEATALVAETLLSLKEFQLTLLDLDGASESAHGALSIYQELGDLDGEMSSLQSLAGNCAFRGDVEGADGYYKRAAELGEKLGQHGSLVWIYLYWGLLHEGIGENEVALELTLKALHDAKVADIPYGQTAVWASLTRMLMRADRLNDAEDAYSKMNNEFEGRAVDASLTLKSAVQRTRGFYHANRKEFAQADQEYASSLELLRSGPLGPFHQAETSFEYASFLLGQGRVGDARSQLEKALATYKSVGNSAGVEKVRKLAAKDIPDLQS